MKIGIAYDTPEMYNLNNNNGLYYDFAEITSINILQHELENLGHQAKLIGNTNSIMEMIKQDTFDCDLVYNTVEGIYSRNREGLLPSLLEINKIPFIGTDAFGLSLTLNKNMTKILAEHIGVLTPAYYAAMPWHNKEIISQRLRKLKLPVILKPNYEGNSSGICKCNSYEEAIDKVIQMIKHYESIILCEEFILGKEVTIPIIGNNFNTLFFGVTTVDIQKNDDFWLDLNHKIFGDYHNILFNIDDGIKQQFKEISFKLFNAIGCNDFARFDYRLTKANKIYFIEVNPLPALFKGGSFDIVGQMYGLSFSETLDLIISTSCKRLSIPKI